MGFSRRLKSLGMPLALAGVAAVMGGCSSSENLEKPDPVPEVVSSVTLKEQWSVSSPRTGDRGRKPVRGLGRR